MSGCRESVTDNSLAVAPQRVLPILYSLRSLKFRSLANFRDPSSRFRLLTKHRFGLRLPVESFTFSLLHYVQSGCRESNPVYLLPKQTYYRYTTPRRYSHRTRVIRFAAGSGLSPCHPSGGATRDTHRPATPLPSRSQGHTTLPYVRPSVSSPHAD